MKTKKKMKTKMFLGVLLSLALVLGLLPALLPGMNLTAKADAQPTYKIQVKDISYNDTRTLAANVTLPYQTTGSALKRLQGYNSTTVSIVLKSGNNITITGTDISITGPGTSNIWVYSTASKYAKFEIIVTKNITATATGYDGSYDGNDHGISVSVSIPASGATVKYGTANGTYNLTESPRYTDVGTYTVYYRVTAGDYNTLTGSAKVKIAKATPSVTALPSASAITYGKTLADSTLSGGAASHGSLQVPGTFTWKTPSAAPTVNDSNSTAFPVVFTPNDTTNYNSVETAVKLTVNKATPTVTALPTASAISYGQTLADSTLSGGTASVPGTFAWKNPSTAPTVNDSNSTTFPIVFTPNDTTNYNSKNADLTVTVADVSFNAVDGGSQTYNKSDLIFRFMMDDDDADTYQYMETFKKATIKGPDIDRALNPDEYTATSGSLKLTLMNSFLETLKPGTYTVTVYFVDETEAHSASANFTVPSSGGTDIPETDENIMLIGAAMILVILSLSAIAYIMLRQRRYLTAKN